MFPSEVDITISTQLQETANTHSQRINSTGNRKGFCQNQDLISVKRWLKPNFEKVVLITFLSPRVETGSNTSTVALRVVGGDEKGTQCLGV
jgi:hypothetical protein